MDEKLQIFLAERNWLAALIQWLGLCNEKDLKQISNKESLFRFLERDIALIDQFISVQLNAILHHKIFQSLEASWRGVYYLHQVASSATNRDVQINLLDMSWEELSHDFERAIEFDQSHFFKTVYTNEFDMPGGKPYGLLIGDFYIHSGFGLDHSIDDFMVLKSISQTAAASFAPFITGVDPGFFGVESYDELESVSVLQGLLQHSDRRLQGWHYLRRQEDSRFVGLTLPRMLMRLPHKVKGTDEDEFYFDEEMGNLSYLWGNSAYAFAAVAIQAFNNYGWFADIRGVRQEEDTGLVLATGGLISNSTIDYFMTDSNTLIPKYSTEIAINEIWEKELSDLGFISLCHCKDTQWSAFFNNMSIQLPKKYETKHATANAQLSAMLQYTLCVSRFAHYLKIIGRAKTGMFARAEELEKYLNDWIRRYVTSSDRTSYEEKARYPLREGRIQVKEYPRKLGSFLCIVHLRPHFQLDQLTAAIRLETEISSSLP